MKPCCPIPSELAETYDSFTKGRGAVPEDDNDNHYGYDEADNNQDKAENFFLHWGHLTSTAVCKTGDSSEDGEVTSSNADRKCSTRNAMSTLKPDAVSFQIVIVGRIYRAGNRLGLACWVTY